MSIEVVFTFIIWHEMERRSINLESQPQWLSINFALSLVWLVKDICVCCWIWWGWGIYIHVIWVKRLLFVCWNSNLFFGGRSEPEPVVEEQQTAVRAWRTGSGSSSRSSQSLGLNRVVQSSGPLDSSNPRMRFKGGNPCRFELKWRPINWSLISIR